MAFRRNKRKEPPRAALLAAVPLRNPQAKERELAGGGVELSVALPKTGLARWLSRNSDQLIARRFELDELGVEVWRMMDGRMTVRAMMESFARNHQLNLREAEVAILAYLRTLASRGIMALSFPEASGAEAARKDGEQ